MREAHRAARRLGFADPEDAAQEAIIIICRRYRDKPLDEQRRIVWGILDRILRTTRRRSARDEELLRRFLEAHPAHVHADPSVRSEAMRAALGELTDVERESLQMYVFDDKSFGEIGRELDVPKSTVATRMQRTLRSLRHRLEGEVEGESGAESTDGESES